MTSEKSMELEGFEEEKEKDRQAELPDLRGKSRYVGVYGITQSGKTVYFACLLHKLQVINEAKAKVQLDRWAVRFPAEVEAEGFRVVRSLERGKKIHPTDPSTRIEFGASFTRWSSFPPRRQTHTFRSHDISGEVFSNWRLQDDITPQMTDELEKMVRRAKGLILLVDPTHELIQDEDAGLQDHVLSSLIRSNAVGAFGRLKRPVAIVLTKADIPSVARRFQTPSRSERDSVETDCELYERATKHQDELGVQFVQKHFPKVWQLIEKEMARRKRSRVTVKVISSTGWEGSDLEQKAESDPGSGFAAPLGIWQPSDPKARRVQPWRVIEPFEWMLEQLRSSIDRHWRAVIVTLILATLFLTGGVMLWFEARAYKQRTPLLADARRLADRGDFDGAHASLAKASAIDASFFGLGDFDETWRYVTLLQEFGILEQYFASGNFGAARARLAHLAKNGFTEESLARCRARMAKPLRAWLEVHQEPLVQSGRWVRKSYRQVLRNAEVAEKTFPDQSWAQRALAVARVRLILVEAEKDISSGPVVGKKSINYLDLAWGKLQQVDEADRPAISAELQFLARRLAELGIAEMKRHSTLASSTPASLHAKAAWLDSLRRQPWAQRPVESEHWSSRLRALAAFREGKPTEGVKAIERLGKAARTQVSKADVESLMRLQKLCEKAAEMVFCLGGTFVLGSTESSGYSPLRKRKVGAFYITKKEITKGQYAQFLRGSGWWPKDSDAFLLDWSGSPPQPPETERDSAVCYVNADDALAYARFNGLDLDLPTEDEWEIAAGWEYPTGPLRPYPYGHTYDLKRTTTGRSAGRMGASPSGCEDMAGGVWEWVKPLASTLNITKTFYLKGGCGRDLDHFEKDYVVQRTRVTYRRKASRERRQLQFGFRCVLRVSAALR